MQNPPQTPITRKIAKHIRRFSSLGHAASVVVALVVAVLLGVTTHQTLSTHNQTNQPQWVTLSDEDQVSINKPEPTNPKETTPQSETPPASETGGSTPAPPNTSGNKNPGQNQGQTNSGSTTPTPPPPPPSQPNWSATAQQMLNLVNQARAAAGLVALTLSAPLNDAANIRAREQVQIQGHTRPNGESWHTVSPLAYGENVAGGHTSVQEVFDAWMNSEGHRANILRPEYRTLGVGYYYQAGTTYLHYWTQLFGL